MYSWVLGGAVLWFCCGQFALVVFFCCCDYYIRSRISMDSTSFRFGLHFCCDTVLSEHCLNTHPFVFQCTDGFCVRVCERESGQMSLVFQLFLASQHQAPEQLSSSGEMDCACVGIMAFSRWKVHRLGYKSCCNKGNQTCLSSCTYRDQYWDYALISVSVQYKGIFCY